MEIDLRYVFRALRRWGWTIALLVILGGGAGFGLASLRSAEYTASTSLLVTPPISSALVSDQNRAETYRNLVESGPVLDRVINELGLEHDRLELADSVEATVVMNTQIIQITATDESAERAADIANSVARNFEDQIADLTVGQLQQNLSELQAQQEDLRARQTDIDGRIAELDVDDNADDSDIQAEIRRLESERLGVSQTLADLDSSIRSINEQLVTATTPVAVADMAVAPEEPDMVSPVLIGVLGAFLGGLIGLGMVSVLEFMDTRLRKGDDIEQLLGSRLLAEVPLADSRDQYGLVALDSPDAPATESIRMLRAHLAGQIARGGKRVIVFTSVRGESPVSKVVGNLGVLMAQSGIRTLIVDAHLRRPEQHQLFTQGNESGLSTVLESGKMVQPSSTEIPSLAVLTSGPEADNPSELIGSARFAELVAAARTEAEVVLIDAPAMLIYSDALSASALADGVVLVASQGTTDRGDLVTAVENIQDDGLTLLGVVVTGR